MRPNRLERGQQGADPECDVLEQLRDGEFERVLRAERARVEVQYVDPAEPLGEAGDRGRSRPVTSVMSATAVSASTPSARTSPASVLEHLGVDADQAGVVPLPREAPGHGSAHAGARAHHDDRAFAHADPTSHSGVSSEAGSHSSTSCQESDRSRTA